MMKKNECEAENFEKQNNAPNLEELWEDFNDGDEYEAPKPSPLLKAITILTAFVFIGFTFLSFWPGQHLPLVDMVKKSFQLKKEIDVQKLQSAVVEINVIAGDGNFPIKASARKGTGFNINNSGLIVTNYHVIKDALNMTITFPDGKIYKAAEWETEPDFDLALIKLNEDNLTTVPLNTQTLPEPGDAIRVVGNPLGLNNIVVDGNVNGYMRVKGIMVFSIDAPIYPGNSGSPVFDQNGRVTGVVFANYVDKNSGQKKTFGLAVPISRVLEISFD